MTSPEVLEQHADDLRAYARQADTKAHALATHLDTVVRSSADSSTWKGAFPTKSTGDLRGWQSALGKAAELLGHDADAWRAKARELDERAQHLRAQQKAERKAEKNQKQPAGLGHE